MFFKKKSTGNKDVNQAIDVSFDEASEEINEQLGGELYISLVGDVNAGKSSTINALLEEELVTVGARPGETVEVKEIRHKDNIVFVDTPGLDDVVTENSAKTLAYYKKSDVILFFLNAAGTVLSENELKTLNSIEKNNQDILIVLNKIDAADDIPSLVDYIKKQTNSRYPVIPISSRTGENLTKLQDALLEILKEKSKDLLLGKELKDKNRIANNWILSAGAAATSVGALPVPGSDFVPLVGIQVSLILKLSSLYDQPISKANAKELVIATVVGNAGKAVFRQVVKFVPGAGSIVGASVAGGTTVALGHAIKYIYEQDLNLNVNELNKIYKSFMKK
ncbi:MAG TPA: GTPase [Pseudogracilibacillus sp.]|nr:GTPase [Pseudogracilibacillus sp.]